MDYMELTGKAFSEMRLLLEGALVLYEGDAAQLYDRTTGSPEALIAFNDIGNALYLLLEQVKKKENRAAGIIGMVCTAASLAVFGPDNFLIPAMILLLAV